MHKTRDEMDSGKVEPEDKGFYDFNDFAKEIKKDNAHLEMDPYLAMAFECVYEDLKPKDEPDEIGDHDLLITRIDPLIPLDATLERAFLPLVETVYKNSCARLLSLITEELELERHLVAVRRIFLMEAGDLLHEFYDDMFIRLEHDLGSMDSTSVTLFLQDCISRRHPEEAERFSLSLPENLKDAASDFFQSTRLSYKVSWPLDIVLDDEAFTIYNQVFLFLLRVKRSIWSLQQIQAKTLAESTKDKLEHRHTSSEEDNLHETPDGTEAFSTALKMHRILLLRSWLFHICRECSCLLHDASVTLDRVGIEI